ncbi:MAG: LuxR C-terminal-related transcriptional regulator [Streptosporangiaceae bacterium]
MGEVLPAGMSAREAEVLDAVAAHLSNAQIAGRLHISARTVESHVRSLLRKFGAADRRELAALAPAATSQVAAVGLPAPWTSFVGRERERATVLAALGKARLVTLVGPGGVGKTRLAVEAARDAASLFPSGCAFADLVPVREGFVAEAAASVLGVSERPQQPLVEAVLEHLAARRALLVLDNCEHLLAEVAAFTERVLAACPGVRVLSTSRERLAVTGEHLVTVPPLSLVADVDGGEAGSEARYCSPTVPVPSARISARPWPSMSCAPGSKACRWRSSWPRRAAHRWGWTVCSLAWTTTCACSQEGAAPIHGTARSGRLSAGATICSMMRNAPCSAASACSPAGSTWMLRAPSAATPGPGRLLI